MVSRYVDCDWLKVIRVEPTLLRPRSGPFSCLTVTSIVGNAPFSSLRTLRWSLMLIFRQKLSGAKCPEHNTEVFDGLKPGQCLWTNFVHFLFKISLEGKRCIDMLGVWLEFVQLTNPGPLATQYFPETLWVHLSAVFPGAIYTTGDVTEEFWLRGNCRTFLGKVLNFEPEGNLLKRFHEGSNTWIRSSNI